MRPKIKHRPLESFVWLFPPTIPLRFSCSGRSTCLVWSGSSGRSFASVVARPPNHSAGPWSGKEREGLQWKLSLKTSSYLISCVNTFHLQMCNINTHVRYIWMQVSNFEKSPTICNPRVTQSFGRYRIGLFFWGVFLCSYLSSSSQSSPPQRSLNSSVFIPPTLSKSDL